MIDQDKLAEMRKQIDEARQVEEEILGLTEESDKPDENGITHRYVSECFRLNERGDGMLFAATHRKKAVYVKKLSLWLHWAGNHWKIDEEDLHINSVDEIAQMYESYAANLKFRADEMRRIDHNAEAKICTALVNKYKLRINKLRTLKGARTCTDYSHRIGADSLSIIGTEIDQKPLLLACKNCVLSLEKGEVVDSKPEDYLLNGIDVEWKGLNEPCPTWEAFFDVIHESDDEIKIFVQKLLGYAITGLRLEHFYAVFIGEGRNGKSTMFEMIMEILGELAWTIAPEMLLEQRNIRSSAGPSADLYSLMGRRMVIASETDDGVRISESQVKRLTGGDKIKTREPYGRKEINFTPTHKLFLHTNHPPVGLAKNYAMAKRLYYINYNLKFIDNPVERDERKSDKDLPEKLIKEKSGILAWLVRGALMWKAEGLNPPAKVRQAVEAQRKNDDYILRYYDSCLDKADDDQFIKFSQLYESFTNFYKDEINADTKYIPSKIKFSKWFVDHDHKTEKKSGEARTYGLTFKPIG